MASDAATPELTEPCPAALATIDAVDPAVLAVMVPNFDPSNAVMVADVAKCAPMWRFLEPKVFESRRSEESDKARAAHQALFEKWLALDGFDASEMNDQQVVRAAGMFSEWLRFDCRSDDPLLWNDAAGKKRKGRGWRKSAQAFRPNTLRSYRVSLKEFVKAGWGPAVAEQLAAEFVTSASADTPPARIKVDMTLDALLALVAVLDERGLEGEIQGLTGAHSDVWHARQKAVLLTQVAGVMRISEVVMRDKHRHVHPTGTSVMYRVPKTKTGVGRDVRLPYLEGSTLCPLTAINDLHELCAEHGYDRKGCVLPHIPCVPRDGVRIRSTISNEEARFLRRIAAKVDPGLFRTISGGPVPADFLQDTRYVFGTHSARRFLPSVAASAGHDLAFISTLGGGAWTDPTHRAMVNHYIGLENSGELSQSLLDEIAAELDEGRAG